MELNPTLLTIDSLKKEAESLQPTKPEWERVFWEKFRLEFNYNSNHMEGSTLTYGQTKLLLLFDRTTGDNKGREIEEMKAHDVALKMITEFSSGTENRLTEKFIREINELILVRPFYNNAITPDGQPTKRLITPGEYKRHSNSVLLPDGNMFYYASPEETPALMGDLMGWYNDNRNKIHPVRLAALMHYKLVRIHPFDDSNGRTTRLVMNFILMQNGYAPLVIESKKKEAYLAALNKADIGNIKSFEEYIAEISIRWQELFLKALKGEKIEESEDFEKEVEIIKRKLLSKGDKNFNLSEDTVSGALSSSIFPLIYNLSNKLSHLANFFKSNRIEVEITKIQSNTLLNSFTRTLIDEIIDRIKSNVLELGNGGVLKIRFSHRGFKGNEETSDFVYNSDIYIEFRQKVFIINFPETNINSVELFYGNHLTESRIYELTDEVTKRELNTIKKLA